MRPVLSILGLSLLLAGPAVAAVKPETAIHYRQAAYTMIGWNFGPMVQMVRGKVPWDGAAFTRHAERVAFIAPQLLEGFPEGSGSGAETEAKPEIWTDMNGFKAKMDDFVRESNRLAEIARAGDEAKAKEQFKATAGACKACHDTYRVDD